MKGILKGIVLIIIIFVIVVISLILLFSAEEVYSVSPEGLLSYTNRPDVGFTHTVYNNTPEVIIWNVVIDSRVGKIHGLYSVPKKNYNRTAFLLLPAQGVDKEGEHKYMGSLLNKMGFVTLSIDLRGQGESSAVGGGTEDEFVVFRNGDEPFSHKAVYEVLRAYDFLKTRPEVDKDKIYILGESLGGRYGIIASAVEPGVAGYIGVSTSGYDFTNTGNQELNRYLFSVEPSYYIIRITPRKVLMVHSRNDPVIPISKGRTLFSKAFEPKKFITLQSNFHGYYKPNTEIEQAMGEGIEWLLE